nr:helix-turn-helix domain-containing protein [Maritimibacter dapengensis]
MQSSFGLALKSMRADLGLSQLGLAEALGSTQRHISFLETGRSRPSPSFVIRLATDLSLSLLQRAALFDAAGMQNPYRRRDFGTAELTELLDSLERRVLRHWPFAGFVLDEDWTVLRANAAGHALFAMFGGETANTRASLFEVMFSPAFRENVLNWDDVSMMFYFRLQAAAIQAPKLAALLDRERAAGTFAHVPERIAEGGEGGPVLPIVFRGPGGVPLRMTSMSAHLGSVREAAIEGLEIELMIPVDENSEAMLLAAGQ